MLLSLSLALYKRLIYLYFGIDVINENSDWIFFQLLGADS